MQRKDLKIEALEQICHAVVEEAGFDLLLMEWTSNSGRRVLRLYIDNEETGVTVGDCATVSRRLSHVLDVEEVIESAYALEVSTPGLDRPLVREADYVRFAGKQAKVTLSQPLSTGRKRLQGELKGVDAGEVSMEVDGELYRFAVKNVARANLVYQGDF